MDMVIGLTEQGMALLSFPPLVQALLPPEITLHGNIILLISHCSLESFPMWESITLDMIKLASRNPSESMKYDSHHVISSKILLMRAGLSLPPSSMGGRGATMGLLACLGLDEVDAAEQFLTVVDNACLGQVGSREN
jgi:hypothetical protein